jgi:hypothetical protein
VSKGTYSPADRIGTLKLRDAVMRGIVSNHADMNFVKTHNQNAPAMGFTLIPPRYTKLAVYIVRHPLDVVLSYARHYGQTVQETIQAISRVDNATSADMKNVEQYLGKWSDHVDSWTRTRKFPVLTMRYEDMKADPHKSFAELVRFLGMDVDEDRLDRAVRFSSFDELRAQEDKSGFVERSEKAEKFFHSGTSGQWRDVLGEEDIAFFRKEHGHVMKRFDYI